MSKTLISRSKNSTKLSETSVSINKSKERNISPSKSLNKEQEDAKANVSVKRKSVSRRKPTRVQMVRFNLPLIFISVHV